MSDNPWYMLLDFLLLSAGVVLLVGAGLVIAFVRHAWPAWWEDTGGYQGNTGGYGGIQGDTGGYGHAPGRTHYDPRGRP